MNQKQMKENPEIKISKIYSRTSQKLQKENSVITGTFCFRSAFFERRFKQKKIKKYIKIAEDLWRGSKQTLRLDWNQQLLKLTV